MQNSLTISAVILMAVWEWSGIHPFGDVVLYHQQIPVVLGGHWYLQDVNCNHLPLASDRYVCEW